MFESFFRLSQNYIWVIIIDDHFINNIAAF